MNPVRLLAACRSRSVLSISVNPSSHLTGQIETLSFSRHAIEPHFLNSLLAHRCAISMLSGVFSHPAIEPHLLISLLAGRCAISMQSSSAIRGRDGSVGKVIERLLVL